MRKNKKPSGLKLYNSDVPEKEDIFVAKKFEKQNWMMGDLGAERHCDEGDLIDVKKFETLGQKSMDQLIENEIISKISIFEVGIDEDVISIDFFRKLIREFVFLKLFACQQGEYGNILELLRDKTGKGE